MQQSLRARFLGGDPKTRGKTLAFADAVNLV